MKVTYVTMAGNEEAHTAYETAVAAVRGALGATHRIEIESQPIGGASFGGAIEAPFHARTGPGRGGRGVISRQGSRTELREA